MCEVCVDEGISAPNSHSGIQADRDSTFFSIELDEVDISSSNAV